VVIPDDNDEFPLEADAANDDIIWPMSKCSILPLFGVFFVWELS
jgi:hypothetical protein